MPTLSSTPRDFSAVHPTTRRRDAARSLCRDLGLEASDESMGEDVVGDSDPNNGEI
jgi:hypothetical protein